MITVVYLFIAAGAVLVAGSKLEATEGQNVSILFKTGLERVDEVRIIFEGERKGKLLLAHYCSPDADPICDPIETPQHVQVKGGNVSLTLVKVNSSRDSGLYTARVITDNQVSEVTATLVVNQAPVSSTAPPHSSSSPKPASSSELQWLDALIPLVIVVSGGVYFWKLRRSKAGESEEETAFSRSRVSTKNKIWKNICGGFVAIPMNGCGENAKALLVP